TSIKDSLYNVETTTQIAAMQAEYDNLQKEKEIQQLSLENKNISIANKNIALENSLKTKQLYLSMLVSALLLALLVLLWRYRQQQQKNLLHQKKMQELLHEQEIKILDAVVEAQQQERTYLAQEVHDTLGSYLAMLRLKHETIKDLMDDANYRKKHLLMEEVIGKMATEVRSITHELYTGEQFSFELQTELELLVSRISSGQKLEVVFHYIGKTFELPRKLELTLYRVVQESLSNVVSHAQATETTVQVSQTNSEISLIIEDNGQGFDPTRQKEGLGLRSMENRVKALDGDFNIDSHPKRGTTIVVEIPID
ncbi:MAG: sensor histidine kinase, partial [Aureispira sp.]